MINLKIEKDDFSRFCPVCVKNGQESNVYPGFGTCTAMYCQPYYDSGGNYHNHDMNTSTQGFRCSLGHIWSISSSGKCPSCDFGEGSDVVTITNDEEIKPIEYPKLKDIPIIISNGTTTTTISGFGSNPITVSGIGICSGSSTIPQFLTLTK